MSAQDRAAGPGGPSEATGVEPSAEEPESPEENLAEEPESPEENLGEIAVPIGSPVGVDELRELKRRAERPDSSVDLDTAVEDPEAFST